MRVPKQLGALAVSLFFLQCGYATPEEATASTQQGLSAATPVADDEALYQESRALMIERSRAKNKALVADMALSDQNAQQVLAALEDEVQAKAELMDYQRLHPGLRVQDLNDRATNDGKLASALERALPRTGHSRIAAVVGPEGLARFMEHKRARRHHHEPDTKTTR